MNPYSSHSRTVNKPKLFLSDSFSNSHEYFIYESAVEPWSGPSLVRLAPSSLIGALDETISFPPKTILPSVRHHTAYSESSNGVRDEGPHFVPLEPDGSAQVACTSSPTLCHDGQMPTRRPKSDWKPREEKCHTCNICSKVFDRPSSLVKHSYIHTDEQPFTCEICSRSFNTNANRTRHWGTCIPRSNKRMIKADNLPWLSTWTVPVFAKAQQSGHIRQGKQTVPESLRCFQPNSTLQLEPISMPAPVDPAREKRPMGEFAYGKHWAGSLPGPTGRALTTPRSSQKM